MARSMNRRAFVKQTAVGTAAASAVGSALSAQSSAGQSADLPRQVVAALGDLFVPSAPGDPGYRDLESHGITEYVLQGLPMATAEGGGPSEVVRDFNDLAEQFFQGRTFLQLDWDQRAQYLQKIIAGSEITDSTKRQQLQGFYRLARIRVFTVYYQNYPEHEIERNERGEAVLAVNDHAHQVTNPNTKELVTGWDQVGFAGPLTWEEEQRQRALMKKLHSYWYEGDLVKLTTD